MYQMLCRKSHPFTIEPRTNQDYTYPAEMHEKYVMYANCTSERDFVHKM